MSAPKLINAFLRTDVGRVRNHNEDFVTFREPADTADEAQNGWLYIVADGVGGADAGEVASQFASERTLAHYLNTADNANWGQRLVDAMQSANTDLRQMVAERDANSRMATTMVAAVFQGPQAFIANVGDSRGYLWRNGRIQQITKDQSLVAKLLEEGAITAEEAEYHPRRNVILYSLGSERTPKIDLFEQSMQPGDIVLLCSDGLIRHVSDDELAEIVTSGEPAQATQKLIELANSRGGQDNISAAILRYEGATEAEQAQARQAHSDPEPPKPDVSKTAVAQPLVRSQPKSLWGLTIALSIVQTILIVTLWAWLFT
ncbi:MAG: Stp1/IreP family PP2C-type Ser/Thr phosphatase [Anaerolineales bacterium]|nr:Stp1/IreP family PP2C-type Ser/Thr phosphatase [Anaerolineales bacterium]